MAAKATILIIDRVNELDGLVRDPIVQYSKDKDQVSPNIVQARNGVEASIKADNQKIDVILIDAETPRLHESGFISNLATSKNTKDAELYVISSNPSISSFDDFKGAHFIQRPFDPHALIEAILQSLFSAQKNDIEQKKFEVDVRVINAVIKATMNVFTQFGVEGLKMLPPATKKADLPIQGRISAYVEIKSKKFNGYLAISFEELTYLSIITKMLMEEQNEITAENQDAVGELNNIIYGNAKADLSNLGVGMSIPKVLLEPNPTIECPKGSAAIEIPFAAGNGKFYITVTAYPQ